MMLVRGILIGFLAAVVVSLPRFAWERLPALDWNSPLYMLGAGLVFALLGWLFIDRRRQEGGGEYAGLADFLAHIHSNPTPETSARWNVRGVISFLLALVGYNAGVEGAGIELSHGVAVRARTHSSHWFEQLRRSDAGAAIAGGVAAAFGAPFGAVLLPMELGIGGRTLTTVFSALTAVLTVHYLAIWAPVAAPDFSTYVAGRGAAEWLTFPNFAAVVIAGIGGGLLGRVLVEFVRYTRNSFNDLMKGRSWLRLLVGALLIALVIFAYEDGRQPLDALSERVLGNGTSLGEVALLGLSAFLSISIVLGVFGTAGVFWPVFFLGGLAGAVFVYSGGDASLGLAFLTGAAALWGAVFGAPIAGGLVAFEMTGEVALILPCLAAALLGREVVRLTRGRTLPERDLEAQGIVLEDGRSVTILESVYVREAMVTDHARVHEHESVADVYERLLASKYPFLAVVNNRGQFAGLLTADMVEEAWEAQEAQQAQAAPAPAPEPEAADESLDTGEAPKEKRSAVPLTELLEAKDLLYRARQKATPVKVDDRLTVTVGMFGSTPVLPVVDDAEEVVGLLFNYNVRIAYDREVARRALFFRHDGHVRGLRRT